MRAPTRVLEGNEPQPRLRTWKSAEEQASHTQSPDNPDCTSGNTGCVLRRLSRLSRRDSDHLGLDQPLKVFPCEANEFSMRAGVKCYLFVLCQALVNEDIYSVEISEGRHRAGFALRESVHEIRF